MGSDGCSGVVLEDNNVKVPDTDSTLKLKRILNKEEVNFYNIMPGVNLLYNNFNVNECIEMEYTKKKCKILEINYCESGRFECVIDKNTQFFLGEGELEINIATIERINPEFPLGYYKGISIIVYIDELKKQLSNTCIEEISEKMIEIYNCLSDSKRAALIKSDPQIIKIFKELYDKENQNNLMYLKLKIFEIITKIQIIPYSRSAPTNHYFSGETIQKIKNAHNEVVSNLETKITLSELADKYKISLTNFKKCFKVIYGNPYYTYLKNYKIHKAVHYLEETKLSISDIALKVGYENPSKFISVFKELVGYTPREYRNKNVHLEHIKLFGVELRKE